MNYANYYIQPVVFNAYIKFDLPVSLDELKLLQACLISQMKGAQKAGYTSFPSPVEDLFNKMEGLIIYLQKEHYD